MMNFLNSPYLAPRGANRALRYLTRAGFLTAIGCCFAAGIYASTAAKPTAAKPTAAKPTAAGAPATGQRLTAAQWEALFQDSAKAISTLHLQAIVHSKFRVTRTMAAQITRGLQQGMPGHAYRNYHATTGLSVITQMVRLDWDVPAGLVCVKKIQKGGYADVGPGGKPLKGIVHASIWVVGHRFFWHAFPGGGVWNVSVGRRSSAWFQLLWPAESNNLGLFALSVYWKPFVIPIVPAKGFAKLPLTYRLAGQKFDPATGLIKLRYIELYNGKVHALPGLGTFEYHYSLRLAGGLRIYRKVYEAVGGPKGTIRFFEADFKKFVKSGGIWFPTRIDVNNRPNGVKRAQTDTTMTIRNVVVNGALPPHVFHYTPPFGAMVSDTRKKPPVMYFVGSKNPKFPPAAMPATGKK